MPIVVARQMRVDAMIMPEISLRETRETFLHAHLDSSATIDLLNPTLTWGIARVPFFMKTRPTFRRCESGRRGAMATRTIIQNFGRREDTADTNASSAPAKRKPLDEKPRMQAVEHMSEKAE